HRADTATGAVADESGGLVVPLGVQVVERVLQRSGEGVVVLGDHEHEAVVGVDRGGPVLGVRVGVLAHDRGHGLVQERQVDLGQVDEVHGGLSGRHGRVFRGGFDDPVGDEGAPTAGTGAAGDDGKTDGHRGFSLLASAAEPVNYNGHGKNYNDDGKKCNSHCKK